MASAKKWQLLTTVPDQITAEIWRDILLKEGIPAAINPGDTMSFLGLSSFPCRIMVDPDYLEPAREILASLEATEKSDEEDS
jgi:hypothetical protein